MTNSAFRLWIAVAIFLSGASTLTYEILWQRQLFLILGASAPATTAILTAIFLGIAFGSLLGTSLLRRAANPVTAYAFLELTIGVWGLIVPTGFLVANQIYLRAGAIFSEGHIGLNIVRFVLAILPLLPATLAMGATIPVMMKVVERAFRSSVSFAYGINILGAVVGSLVTGFVSLEALGISNTRFTGVGTNFAAAAILLSLSSQSLRETERTVSPVTSRMPARWILLSYFLAGFIALGFEVIWLRFLGITSSNSTMTFTLTLAIYLTGMGLGSLVLYPLLRKLLAPGVIYVFGNAGAGFAALITFRTLYAAVEINDKLIVEPSVVGSLTLANIYQAEALIIGCLVFLPTLFMGLVYPAVCDLQPDAHNQSSQWIARTYFAGTLGSVGGILFVAMVLIPVFQLHGTFALLTSLSLVIAIFATFKTSSRAKSAITCLLICGIGWACWIAWVSQPVLREGVARQVDGRWLQYTSADSSTPVMELVRMRAGSSGTVYIKKAPERTDHYVFVDDQLVASTNMGARVDALMLAHLPLLLHPAPHSALTVGFGSGGTSYAMTTHGIKTYCVEIEPEVPRSADLLEHQNFDVLHQPNFHLILNDARDHLHLGTRKYDVISTDVTNLQYKQNSSLYTVEYFELMKRQLNENGIACAWIPMAAIKPVELKILMQSFQHVYPHATLWFMNNAHTNFGILIGTPEPLLIDYKRLKSGFDDQQIGGNLRLIGMVEPLELVHCLQLDEDGYRSYCGDVVVHTDDRPVLEFSSPLSFYEYMETFRENLNETLALRPTDFRRYVTGADDVSDADWTRHQIASRCFCYVLLESYDYVMHRRRGELTKVLEDLKRSLAIADEGMAAWPEDQDRQEFYESFFTEAQSWIESQR